MIYFAGCCCWGHEMDACLSAVVLCPSASLKAALGATCCLLVRSTHYARICGTNSRAIPESRIVGSLVTRGSVSPRGTCTWREFRRKYCNIPIVDTYMRSVMFRAFALSCSSKAARGTSQSSTSARTSNSNSSTRTNSSKLRLLCLLPPCRAATLQAGLSPQYPKSPN